MPCEPYPTTKLLTHSAVDSKIQNRSQLIHRIHPHPVFTARCYAERGYEIACRLSSPCFTWEFEQARNFDVKSGVAKVSVRFQGAHAQAPIISLQSPRTRPCGRRSGWVMGRPFVVICASLVVSYNFRKRKQNTGLDAVIRIVCRRTDSRRNAAVVTGQIDSDSLLPVVFMRSAATRLHTSRIYLGERQL